MTLEEVAALCDENVTVRRNGATWTGTVSGVHRGPVMILEDEDGRRVAITIEGAEIERAEA